MLNDIFKKGFENKAICNLCGGECCKRMPGVCYPGDFKLVDKKSIIQLLLTGKYAIDYWNNFNFNQKNGYYIRPNIKNNKSIVHPAWGGECIFLTEHGCELKFNERPTGCRYLEPQNGNCEPHEKTKLNAAKKWYKRDNILNEIVKELYNKKIYEFDLLLTNNQ